MAWAVSQLPPALHGSETTLGLNNILSKIKEDLQIFTLPIKKTTKRDQVWELFVKATRGCSPFVLSLLRVPVWKTNLPKVGVPTGEAVGVQAKAWSSGFITGYTNNIKWELYSASSSLMSSKSFTLQPFIRWLLATLEPQLLWAESCSAGVRLTASFLHLTFFF